MAQASEMHMRVSVDPKAIEELERATKEFNEAVQRVHDTAGRVRAAMSDIQFAFKVAPE